MKHSFILFLLFTACQKEETNGPQVFLLQQETLLHYQQATRFAEAGVIVTLQELDNHLCPEATDCERVGSATATFRLQTENGPTQILTLCVGECRPWQIQPIDSALIQMQDQPYWLHLKKINSKPGVQPKRQAVTILLKAV